MNNMSKSLLDHPYLGYFLIFLMSITGFYFRYLGIIKNISFWNDEIHAAFFSRSIVWYGQPITETGVSTGLYQVAFYYITAIFFYFWGVIEFAGRLPSVIVGTSLILLIYFITKRVYNNTSAFLAALLMAFSQIQLAWSTQLRPYVWLELFTLLIFYFSYKSLNNLKTVIDKYLLTTIGIALLASLFHGTGLIDFALVGILLVAKCIRQKRFYYLLILLPLSFLTVFIIYSSLPPIHRNISSLLHFNFDTLHYRIFLKANYSWLIGGAVFGSFFLFRKNKILLFVLLSFICTIFLIAIFKINVSYVRYSLPAFPLLYILFSIGVSSFLESVFKLIKNTALADTLVYGGIFLVFFATTLTKKTVIMPSYYYTINGDVREIPLADYKQAFEEIRKIKEKHKDAIIMDAWNDRVPWYMPGHKFIYLIQYRTADYDYFFGEKMISTVKEFQNEKDRYQKGIVLLENWESQTSIELQNYIKVNLQHHLDIHNLPYNNHDKWSVSIYSWGI